MFTHLHCHSWFSLGEGASSPEALIAAAGARGFAALACTDTNAVYGAVEFQRVAEEAGIRPIQGAHLVQGGEECVALAMDERGWGALCRAITAIHWAEGRKGGRAEGGETGALAPDATGALEPGAPGARTGGPPPAPAAAAPAVVSWAEGPTRARGARSIAPDGPPSVAPSFRLPDLLAHDRGGLLLLSASIPFLARVITLSGPRDVYAELCPGTERHAVLAAARRLGIPPVVTNAVRFAHPQDWARHRLLVAIANNGTLSEDGRTERRKVDGGITSHLPSFRPSVLSSWLKPTAELARHFPDVPEALDRAGELAERCRYRIPIGERVIPPRYAEAADAQAELRALAYDGAARRYGTIAPITRERLEHELRIIGMKGFADRS